MELHLVDRIRDETELSDHVVIIDTFRASNSIITAFENGAECIYPVANDTEAKQVLDELAEKGIEKRFYIGEWRGDKLTQADANNSPTQIAKYDLDGYHIVMRTTRGVPAIIRAEDADTVVVGTFGNAKAVAQYLMKTNPDDVYFIACGELDHELKQRRATEDFWAAIHIMSIVGKHGSSPLSNFDNMMNDIKRSGGAKRLRAKGQRSDINACLKLDYSKIIPRVYHEDGRPVIKRYEG